MKPALEIGRAGSLADCKLHHDPKIFDSATVNRMLRHLGIFFDVLLADPHGDIGRVSLLTAEERQALLVGLNRTTPDVPWDKGIDQLVEERAARQPESVALLHGDASLGYGALNRAANRIAHRLIANGLRAEDPVALRMEPCIEMVIGLLAVLKAGGAYLPLDPSHPEERIGLMLAEARARFVLLPLQPGSTVEQSRARRAFGLLRVHLLRGLLSSGGAFSA